MGHCNMWVTVLKEILLKDWNIDLNMLQYTANALAVKYFLYPTTFTTILCHNSMGVMGHKNHGLVRMLCGHGSVHGFQYSMRTTNNVLL